MAGLVSGTASGAMASADLKAQDGVAAELSRWAETPFDWRDDNCGLAVLDYVEREIGRRWRRPLLRGRRMWVLRMRDAGGLEAYCAHVMGRLGVPATADPVRGDVGVVPMEGTGPIVAICLGRTGAARLPLWAARGDRQVVFQPAEPIAAWQVRGDDRCPKR